MPPSIDRPTRDLPWPVALDYGLGYPSTLGRLADELGRTSPELRALEAGVTKEERAIALAKKDYYPDLTFGLQWIETGSRSVDDLRDNGQDALIGSVSVNLPVWWEKYGSGVREAEARRAAANERRSDREQRARQWDRVRRLQTAGRTTEGRSLRQRLGAESGGVPGLDLHRIRVGPSGIPRSTGRATGAARFSPVAPTSVGRSRAAPGRKRDARRADAARPDRSSSREVDSMNRILFTQRSRP